MKVLKPVIIKTSRYSLIHSFILLFSITLFGLSCAADKVPDTSHNSLTQAEKESGWVLLFDGETFAGWRGHGRDDIPEGHWVVQDGTITKVPREDVQILDDDGQPIRGGDLLYDQPFENFELSFEWKLSPGANSGIKYNVSEKRISGESSAPGYSALGFEYQMLDNDDYPDGDPNMLSAALYDLVSVGSNAELNPAGSWNSGRIIFNGNYGSHWLNGKKVLEYELGTHMMNRLLQTSKWKDVPDFGKRRKAGYIVLQDHNDAVRFRNVKLRELTPPS